MRDRARPALAAGALALNAILLAAPGIVLAGPGFFTDPAAVVFLILAQCFAAAELASPAAFGRKPERVGAASDEALATAAGAATLLVFWAAVAERAAVEPSPGSAHVAAGIGLMMVGICLRVLAIRALGPAFVSDPLPRGELVGAGIYGVMRHPSEAGLLLITLGACVLLASVTGAVLWAALCVPLSAVRTRREDRALAAAFGAVFAPYAAGVPALVPRWPGRASPTLAPWKSTLPG